MGARETTVGALIERMIEYREALKFYAEKENWEGGEVEEDGGERARKALEA